MTCASRDRLALPGDFEVMDNTICPPLVELVICTLVVLPEVTVQGDVVVTVGSELNDAVTLGVAELPFGSQNV
jgi:hypothetical protein